MAITRNTSAHVPSLTPSDNSDMYYEGYDHTPSPMPSQTADIHGWESDQSPAPMDSDMTPTPQAARLSSLASVMEILKDEFPPLATPAPAMETKPHTKATKANKGNGRAKAVATIAATPTRDNDNPFLAADTAATTTASLGPPLPLNHAMEEASTSRRPAAEPGSPSKHCRSNTAGDASPAPVPTMQIAVPVAAAPATVPTAAAAAAPLAAHAAAPLAAPAAVHSTAPVKAPATTPATAPFATLVTAPAIALATAPVAVPIASPAITTPATTYAAAPVAAPVAGPAVAPATVLLPLLPPCCCSCCNPRCSPRCPCCRHPSLWLTADGLPPRSSYTLTPASSFPPIVYSPEQLLQGVPADLIGMYEEVAFPKFFLVVSGGNGAVMKTHGLICEAIGNYVNIDPTAFTLAHHRKQIQPDALAHRRHT
ncbi:hypothetical protein B0H14DRAFT_3444162 [Mycena olivaceomarginata]|nr:hypothetical protein B0H14DRAFT_3444162 [Mycena olivaceomarginata]